MVRVEDDVERVARRHDTSLWEVNSAETTQNSTVCVLPVIHCQVVVRASGRGLNFERGRYQFQLDVLPKEKGKKKKTTFGFTQGVTAVGIH